jgi:hypothetical protein
MVPSVAARAATGFWDMQKDTILFLLSKWLMLPVFVSLHQTPARTLSGPSPRPCHQKHTERYFNVGTGLTRVGLEIGFQACQRGRMHVSAVGKIPTMDASHETAGAHGKYKRHTRGDQRNETH